MVNSSQSNKTAISLKDHSLSAPPSITVMGVFNKLAQQINAQVTLRRNVTLDMQRSRKRQPSTTHISLSRRKLNALFLYTLVPQSMTLGYLHSEIIR
jgi:hypothetical protein